MATGTNVCDTWDIDREHCSPIAWSSLAYRAVIHDGGFKGHRNGAFFYRTVHLHADRLHTVDP